MKFLKDRLQWAIEQKEKRDGRTVSKAALSRAAKVSSAAVTYWFDGDTKSLKPQVCRDIASFLGVDAIWLETGKGEPSIRSGSQQLAARRSDDPGSERLDELMVIIEAFKEGDDTERKMILDLARTINTRIAINRARSSNDS